MNGLEGWLTIVLSIVNLILMIGAGIGGVLAFRSGLANAERVVQERVRAALHDENELLRSQATRQDREMVRFKALVQLLIETFKKYRNIDVEMQSDRIIIRDGAQTLIAQLPESHDGAGA